MKQPSPDDALSPIDAQALAGADHDDDSTWSTAEQEAKRKRDRHLAAQLKIPKPPRRFVGQRMATPRRRTSKWR